MGTRHILTVLLPGSVAVAPWVFVTAAFTTVTFGQYQELLVIWFAMFAGLAILAASAVEQYVARWQCRLDAELEDELDVHENRRLYAARVDGTYDADIDHLSGDELSTDLMLSLQAAAPCFLAGLAARTMQSETGVGVLLTVLLAATAVLSSLWFRRQARDGHRRLCELRRDLNRRFGPSHFPTSLTVDAGQLEVLEAEARSRPAPGAWPA